MDNATFRPCPWCRHLNEVASDQPTHCDACGHRGDLARIDCDCSICRCGCHFCSRDRFLFRLSAAEMNELREYIAANRAAI